VNAAIAEVTEAARLALSASKFDDAAWCAGLANELSKLCLGDTPTNTKSTTDFGKNVNGGESEVKERGYDPQHVINDRSRTKDDGQSALQKERIYKVEYPIFYKDHDTLIKIGWSKSQDGEYEHRAPKVAVDSLARAVKRVGVGKPTSMEALLPLQDGRGSELPSYQAYLALAWLRACGAVQRHGQDGYSLTPEFADVGAIEKLWNRLTTIRPGSKS
jgi:hypothetical protein